MGDFTTSDDNSLEKSDTAQDTARNRRQKMKPLPATPSAGFKPLPPKPLPDLPAKTNESSSSNHLKTFLFISALCIWFLAIVLLLPIITERDAMPGLNRFLRRVISSIIKDITGDQREEL